jgi:hypothetical protein
VVQVLADEARKAWVRRRERGERKDKA